MRRIPTRILGARRQSQDALAALPHALVAGLVLAVSMAVTAPAGASASVTITEFPAAGNPGQIAVGPDGNLWFSQNNDNQIVRISTSGVSVNYSVPTASSFPQGVVSGPDGNVWFTEQSGGKVGFVTTSGSFTEYSVGGYPTTIAVGPDGNLWFTQYYGNKIGRITTGGTLTEFAVPTASSDPDGIVAGPDGNLWFTEHLSGKIGRISTSGVITEYSIPTAGSDPDLITSGADGNLWFTEQGANQVGRITTGGTFAEFPVPTANSGPIGIGSGPDGNVWFTEESSGNVARITPDGTITEFALPTGGSFPQSVVSGPDGNLWFTETGGNQIARLAVPSFASTPAGVSFGSQPVGTTSSAMSVTISNAGPGGPLHISGLTVGGNNPGDFSLTSDGCTGVDVAVNGTCSVGVSFSPTATGPRTATLIVGDNGLDGPGSVPLSGIGAESADLAISLGATPNPVKVGRTLTYTMTVRNFGPTGASTPALSDALPSTVQFVSFTTTQGTCTTPALGATGTVNCDLGGLAQGAAATITIVTKVITTARATISDTAAVSSQSFDPQSNNNAATVVTNVFGRH